MEKGQSLFVMVQLFFQLAHRRLDLFDVWLLLWRWWFDLYSLYSMDSLETNDTDLMTASLTADLYYCLILALGF